MSAMFQLKTAKNKKCFFNLLAKNGEVILTSQMYASRETAKKGIVSVKANASEPSRFEEKVNKKGQHYFVLKAGNHQVIGTGEAYSSAAAMRKGINSVSNSAPKAGIEIVK